MGDSCAEMKQSVINQFGTAKWKQIAWLPGSWDFRMIWSKSSQFGLESPNGLDDFGDFGSEVPADWLKTNLHMTNLHTMILNIKKNPLQKKSYVNVLKLLQT